MIDKYEEIFDRYKKFLEENSQYSPKVVKYNTNTSPYFPVVVLTLSDNKDTNYCTNDKVEFYEEFYFTINIYTKNEKKGNNIVVASQIINNELTKLTILFFDSLNMKRTLNRPTPNYDDEVLRRTIQYQCLIGNIRGNIIRR